jgi:hypothetical protein
VININQIDRLDCRISVGVRGDQCTAGLRHEVHRLFKEVDPIHPWHPIVGQDGGHLLAA